MTKKSKLVLAMASMLGITAGATAVSGFAWFATAKSADLDISNIGIYSKSSGLNVNLLTSNLVGVTDNSSTTGNIHLIGATGAATSETFEGDGSNKTFTIKQYPSAKPTVTVDGNPVDAGDITWTQGATGKTLTLATEPANGKPVVISYTPYAALTDTSSIDGQNIYKPVWTASGEGQYATDILRNQEEGYIQFSMTIQASGNAALEVYLDRPSIDPVNSAADSPDSYAAAITRVAFVEDKDTDETLLILQNNIGSNNQGLSKTLVDGGKNYDSDDEGTDPDLYNIATLCGTVSSTIFQAPEKTVAKANQPGSWGVDPEHRTKANNWLCTLNAGETKTIIVSIWLEGTSGNTSSQVYGSFVNSPANGMIKVNLPLVAF